MCGVRRAVGIAHELAVSVVRGDEEFSAEAEGLLDDLFHGVVDDLDSFHGCLDNSGMADHVGIGEVQDDEIEVLEVFHDGFRDFLGGHLRFEIVGGDVFG